MKKITFKSILVLTILMMLMVSPRAFAAGISKKSLTLSVGESTKLTVSGSKKVSWKSSKKSIAKVSKKGVVKAVKAGSCKITAKAGKKTFTCKVKVVKDQISGSSAKNTASVSPAQEPEMSAQEKAVYQKIIAKRSMFPEGRHWTNADHYIWNGGIFSGGYGCAAFAFCLSDAAFGDAPARMHKDVNNIRVGDLLRTDNDTHMVIVLSVSSNGLVVAEGNYNCSIHWGRRMSSREVRQTVDYVLTRY